LPPDATRSLALDGVCILQQLWQLRLLCLEVRVATDVLVVNEDVRDGALVGDVFESVLNCAAIVDLIQLNDVRLDAHLAQQGLGRLAIRAIRLGEDSDGVVVDDILRFGLCGHDGVWAGGACREYGT